MFAVKKLHLFFFSMCHSSLICWFHCIFFHFCIFCISNGNNLIIYSKKYKMFICSNRDIIVEYIWTIYDA